eukprot:186262-Pyramimonas_sp.AAC.1
MSQSSSSHACHASSVGSSAPQAGSGFNCFGLIVLRSVATSSEQHLQRRPFRSRFDDPPPAPRGSSPKGEGCASLR